jgi:ribosomal protein S18 acetylase RimI-like enzyme
MNDESDPRVEILGVDQREAAVSLWEEAGLTRPWNDPRRDFNRAVSSTSAEVIGLVDHHGLVATAMVGYDGHRGWVYYVAVEERSRGLGLGTRVMAAAEDWLRRVGAPKVQLMVRSGNGDASDFYRHLGYEDAGVTVLGRWLDR